MTTKPTVSYGIGFFDDGGADTLANWGVSSGSNMTFASATVEDDVFAFTGTVTGGSPHQLTIRNAPLFPMGLSATVFTKFRARYKTDGSGIKLSIWLKYTDGFTQYLVTTTTRSTWKTDVLTTTPGHGTIDYIFIKIQDETGTCYVDFVMVYKDDFALPNTRFGQTLTLPLRYGKMDPVGMAGQFTQNLGVDLAEFTCVCDPDIGNWKRAGDVIDGEIFADIAHNILNTDWVWLNTGEDLMQFKASIDHPEFQRTVHESLTERQLHLTFYEFRRSGAQGETYDERWGLTT